MIYFVFTFFVFIIYKSIYNIYPSELVKAFPLVLLIFGIYRYALFNKAKIYFGKNYNAKSFYIYLAFLAVFSFSILRKSMDGATVTGNINQSLQYCLLVFITYSFFNYQFKKQRLPFREFVHKMLPVLLIAPALFIMLDIVFYFLGFTGEKTDLAGHQSVLSSLVGLNLQRTHFFLAGHHNNAAMTVGSIVSLALIALFLKLYKGKEKIFLLTTLLFGLFYLLLADVRGVFVAIVVSLLVLIMFRRTKVMHLFPLFIFLPLLFTLLVSPLLNLLSNLDHETLSSFSRSQGELLTFNNRIYIWEPCIAEMKDFKFEHLLGYGQVGHATSGLQSEWEWILPGRVTHNVYLQSFLDMGYIGLFLLMATIYVSLKDAIWLYHRGLKEALILIPFFIYFCYSGFSEVSIGLYNHPYTAVFLLLSLLPILLKNIYIQNLRIKEAGKSPQSASEKMEASMSVIANP